MFFGIDEDANDDFVEQFAAAFDDVEMTVGDGVERTGVNGAPHECEW